MAFAGIVAGAAGVIAVGAEPMTPTIVHHDGTALDFGDVGRGGGICLCIMGWWSDSRGVVGTMKSALLGGELVAAFHIFIIEVGDEVWQCLFYLWTFPPVTAPLRVKSGVLEHLESASDDSTGRDGFAGVSGKGLDIGNAPPQRFNAVVDIEGMLEAFFVGFELVGGHFCRMWW